MDRFKQDWLKKSKKVKKENSQTISASGARCFAQMDQHGTFNLMYTRLTMIGFFFFRKSMKLIFSI